MREISKDLDLLHQPGWARSNRGINLRKSVWVECSLDIELRDSVMYSTTSNSGTSTQTLILSNERSDSTHHSFLGILLAKSDHVTYSGELAVVS